MTLTPRTETPERELHPLPFPHHLPVPSSEFLRRRAAQTFGIATRHFAPLIWRSMRRRDIPDGAYAAPLRKTFEHLGATYVKFGQLIGSAPGVFGEEIAAEFRSCLDTGPAIAPDDVRRIIENEIGRHIEDAFPVFDEVPIAAASIAVVHKAVTPEGREVAVKVLRPGIEGLIAADVDLIGPIVELLARQVGIGIAGPLLELVDGFRSQVAEELDLRNEARTMAHHRLLLDKVDLPLVIVPEPLPHLSGRTVLTMEFLDGVPIDDLARIREFGVDPVPRVEQVVRGWFVTALRNGVFHGDVHAGNLMVLRDGRIGVIDWGIVGRLDPSTATFFRRLVEAALGEEDAWEDIAGHIVDVYGQEARDILGLTDADLRAFVRSQIEPILTQPFGDVSLASFLETPEREIARARGEEIASRNASQTFRALRQTRKLRRTLGEQVGDEAGFDRGMFLLGKQLMYFERYGKMFLSDRPLLSDEAFFRAVLAEGPLV